MKTSLLTLFMLGLGATVSAQNVNIPDANFKAALVADTNINTNKDSEIQFTEALFYNGTINVANESIADMTGIGSFPALTGLICDHNDISDLDLSGNAFLTTLKCNHNKITDLDISSIGLEGNFECNDNLLSNLDLGSQPDLEGIWCFNNRLTDLDVSGCASLEELNCDDNWLQTIDFPVGTTLEHLFCSNNFLDSLNLSLLTDLEEFEADSNELVKLNLSNGNNTLMETPSFRWNPDLECIQVDDSAYANDNWMMSKDAGAEYTENCLLFGTGLARPKAINPFAVFPNPAQSQFTVELTEPAGIVLINALGQPVYTENMLEAGKVRISGLAPGIYHVQISTATGRYSEPVLIVR